MHECTSNKCKTCKTCVVAEYPCVAVASNQSLWPVYMQAWLIFLFPLHFFFHFLYYTDVGSVTFVVAAYLVSLAVPILLPFLTVPRCLLLFSPGVAKLFCLPQRQLFMLRRLAITPVTDSMQFPDAHAACNGMLKPRVGRLL